MIMKSQITSTEFERQYADRSGITVEKLRSLGRVVVVCHCEETECEGWASVSRQFADQEELSIVHTRE